MHVVNTFLLLLFVGASVAFANYHDTNQKGLTAPQFFFYLAGGLLLSWFLVLGMIESLQDFYSVITNLI